MKRVKNHKDLKVIIQEWTLKYEKKELVDLLNEHRVPACPIYDLREASEDPHICGARKMVQTIQQKKLGYVKVQGNPIKMSATDPKPRGPAPNLGGDTESILGELLNVSSEEYWALKKKGVV
jgi:formyl-CoA transferase